MIDELKMIASRVREMREILGMSAGEIAEKIGSIWHMKMHRMTFL